MRSNKHNYDNTRFYSSSKIHSDTWSGNPCDSKVVLFVEGDKLNTIEFFKPKKIDKNFFNKQNNYDDAIKRYGFKKIKKLNVSKLTIFDQACLHRTVNKNRDLRLSLDFGITLTSNKQKKKFVDRYKKRFIEKVEKDPVTSQYALSQCQLPTDSTAKGFGNSRLYPKDEVLDFYNHLKSEGYVPPKGFEEGAKEVTDLQGSLSDIGL